MSNILGGLVGITACASVVSTWESLIVGFIGALVSIASQYLLPCLKIDDPVGAIPVHFVGGIWSTLAVGLFGTNNAEDDLQGRNGLFHGGGFMLLGVQILGVLVTTVWAVIISGLIFLILKYTIGVRMTPAHEVIGADWVYHAIRRENEADLLEVAIELLDEEQLAIVRQHFTQLKEPLETTDTQDSDNHETTLTRRRNGTRNLDTLLNAPDLLNPQS